MAKRYIGDATVTIKYDDAGDYRGTVSAHGHHWRFSNLHPPRAGFDFAYDSPAAYDKMAASAVGFGGYYTTHNRGDDLPDWAPSAETADAISDATGWAMDDRGDYDVRRSPLASKLLANGPDAYKTWVMGVRRHLQRTGYPSDIARTHDRDLRGIYLSGASTSEGAKYLARAHQGGYLANPSPGGWLLALGAVAVGGVVLYLVLKPKTAAAADSSAAERSSSAPASAPAQNPAASPNTPLAPQRFPGGGVACSVDAATLGTWGTTNKLFTVYLQATTTAPPLNTPAGGIPVGLRDLVVKTQTVSESVLVVVTNDGAFWRYQDGQPVQASDLQSNYCAYKKNLQRTVHGHPAAAFLL